MPQLRSQPRVAPKLENNPEQKYFLNFLYFLKLYLKKIDRKKQKNLFKNLLNVGGSMEISFILQSIKIQFIKFFTYLLL